MTPFLQKDGPVKLTYRFKCSSCDCGHKDCRECRISGCTNGNSNIIQVERRKFFRKKVNLQGSLIGETGRRHPLRVLDLSRTGLRTRMLSSHKFLVGRKVQVEFTLDDVRETAIVKQIVIRRIDGKTVDGEFTEHPDFARYDKAIGFYLMK